ncbi:hypothetical protein NE235_13140 [Actinoallomurus spadix]|uniref:Lipoprotein n=1 Tax=Actinoallomurus spadix TaxID=79912 RepID=A0ABN0X7T2_9ACTN|nr:hypothetical protein [Actinoallomurus spadix]MCO5987046.1 hypothetical protein [Actinoallomurus spadix]
MRFRMCVGPLVLAGLLTACGGRDAGGFHPSGRAQGDDSPMASSSSSPGTAPRSDASAGAASDPTGGGGPLPRTPRSALAAYREYQRMYEQAYESNDAGRLDSVAMDPLLSIIERDIGKIKRQGVFWRFHNVLNPRVQGSSKDASTVVILDCVRTLGSYRFSARTGRRLAAWRDGSHLYQAVMRYTDGTYKISDATEGRKC